MIKDLAPIILFIYNRPDHTKKTLEALHDNLYANESVLYVFADGPKDRASADDLNKIAEARNVVKERLWCKEVILITREKNMKLEDNVIEGISQIINKHGKAIILEDDLVTSPFFLQYCNEGLKVYENAKQVFSINGFMFPIDFSGEPETFLCPLAISSWGWATWADRWNQFEKSPMYINEIENNKFLRNRFNFGDYDFFRMLKDLNTWDIRWYYTAFTRNGLGVFPTRSLVRNIGFDGSGTHTGNGNLEQELFNNKIKMKESNSINHFNYSKMLNFFMKKQNSKLNKLKIRFNKILNITPPSKSGF